MDDFTAIREKRVEHIQVSHVPGWLYAFELGPRPTLHVSPLVVGGILLAVAAGGWWLSWSWSRKWYEVAKVVDSGSGRLQEPPKAQCA